MSKSHTPTPWKIHEGIVYDANECDVQPSYALARGVRAVNAHESLVSALRKIADSCAEGAEDRATLIRVEEIALAAIQLAKGE